MTDSEAITTSSSPARGTPPLVYSGNIIRDRGEMLSLTDMWKAAGSHDGRRPDDWRKDAANRAFLDHVASFANAPVEGIWKGRRGSGGGTFAHWQVALAYAKYLSPEFHMWCNTVVRERMQGAPVAAPLINMNAIGGMVKGILARQLHEIVPSLVAAEIATHNIAIRRGKTAGQIWKEHGFPPIRLGGWFSRRLVEMKCEIDGAGRGELGLSTARLFCPDKAAAWIRNGGRLMVERKLAERQGQGRLRLVAIA